jgi:hypothetical protein
MSKFSEKHEIALYALYGNGEHLKMVTDFTEEDEDWCRLTEPMEIQFTYLPDEVTVPGRIASIQCKIDEVRARTARDIASYEEEIKKLQAITYQPEPEVTLGPGYDGEEDVVIHD